MKDKNKNRRGYKETKVGWIPEEWTSTKLGKQTKIRRGASPRPIKNPKWFALKGRGWVRISDVTKCRKYLSETVQYLSPQGVSKSVKVNPGNIILSICATIGIPRIVGIPVCIHDGFITLSELYNINTHYTFYLLVKLTPILSGLGQHGTQKNINADIVRTIPIPLPPLPEQKAIASVLDCWDKSIQKYEEKIEKKKNIKKGLMQKLLSGEQRLPGFDGEWEETRLEMMGKIISGGTPSTGNSDYWAGSIPWCTPSEVVALDGKYISSTKRCISRKGLKKSSANLLSPNSLIVCTRATIGNCAINTVPMATNQGFKSIDAYVNTYIEFLFYSIVNIKKTLIRLGSGSTFLEVSTADFRKIKVSAPPLPEQKAIASVLSSADSEIKALEKKLALLRDQKKYLLNNLVTGTIRLPEFCKEVG